MGNETFYWDGLGEHDGTLCAAGSKILTYLYLSKRRMKDRASTTCYVSYPVTFLPILSLERRDFGESYRDNLNMPKKYSTLQ